jgi:glycosyltransferase involved in cell wall biosynthesis
MLEPHEILFLGLGKSPIMWYRIALPGLHLGADWCGIVGEPPNVQVVTGLVGGDTKLPSYSDYKLVVIQQPHGRAWLKQINALRAQGIKVLYEVDDYLHGVAKQPHHDFAKFFTPEHLKGYEICMKAVDGLIVSTDYLARRYAKFNRTIYVCKNGIDLARYNLTRPERKTVNIIWTGATGHMAALLPWMNEVIKVMHEHPNTCFVAIGQPGLAAPINQILGEGRALGVPFAPLECYPAAMCLGDISLAPAGETSWYRAKSSLRFLEAAALGIPTIGHPGVYAEIEPGVTGYHAVTPREAAEQLTQLIENPDLAREIGQNAYDYVSRERASDIAAAQWFEVCSAAVGEHESLYQLARGGTR